MYLKNLPFNQIVVYVETRELCLFTDIFICSTVLNKKTFSRSLFSLSRASSEEIFESFEKRNVLFEKSSLCGKLFIFALNI